MVLSAKDEARAVKAAKTFGFNLSKARWDTPTYARLLGIEVHLGQVRFFQQVLARAPDAVKPAYLNLALSSGNRAGKTLALTIAVLQHAQFKIGLPPPGDDSETALTKWRKHPWHGYHFGVQQEVADLMWQDAVMLFDGTHPGQKGRGCPLVDFLGRKIVETGKKERGEYRWIVFSEQMGGGEIHFRTTNEKAVGQLGKDMNLITYDECGFDPNLTWIVNEVLHMRRLSTSGQLILISTPSESFQQFSDEWARGDPESPDRQPYHMSIRMSTRDNIGFGIENSAFARIVASMPKHLVAQNIDGHFIEGRNAFFNAISVDACFDPDMPLVTEAEADHMYVQGIDPAMTHDATWSITLDYTNPKVVLGVRAERREGKQSMPRLVALISEVHYAYNENKARAMTACDTSGMGGKVFKEALSVLHPFRAVEFGGVKSRKMKLLIDLKGYIESGILKFPKQGVWLGLRKQLLAYRLDDSRLDTDAVMALAVAVKQLVAGTASVAVSEIAIPFDMYDETPSGGGLASIPKKDQRPDAKEMVYTDATTPGEVGRRIRAGANYEVL